MSESSGGKSRRRSQSLFGPIVLIAIGAYFLLYNLGAVSGLNWMAALQLWPLLLIFIGINVIVRQAPRPFGSFLSGLVGLLAVLVFGYVVFFSEDNPILSRLGVSNNTNVQREEIEFTADDINSAVINIDFGLPRGEIYALQDSRNLIEGSVSYMGDLVFENSVSGRQATVTLGDRHSGGWFFNPSNWVNFSGDDRWQIGLNPNVATNLRVGVGAGSVNLDLSELTLTELDVNGGAGSVELRLPGGDYDVTHDVGAGSVKMWLPEDGRHTIEVDGGAGSMTFYLPSSMAARVEVDRGMGSFSVDKSRFTQVEGDEPDDGVWETAGYEDARNRVTLIVDIGAGSVRIVEP